MTNPIAQVCRVAVRRVLHWVQAELRAQVVGLGPAQPEYRVPGPGAHRRESISSGTTEQVQEDGLCLIVGRVAGGGTGRESPEPSRTRPRLEVGPCTNVHPVDYDLDPERSGDRGYDLSVLGGVLTQAVVDVMCSHITAGDYSEHEQGERVGASGHGA